MAESSQARRLRLTLDGEDDNIDRLSFLSQCILLHILSFLDLKEAAATSILSRNWRNLFIALPTINLTFSHTSADIRLFRLFTFFARRVLHQRDQDVTITNFKLHIKPFTRCYRPYLDPLLECTDAVLSNHKVKEFDLKIKAAALSSELESCFIFIPFAIFSSDSLTTLRLAFPVEWDVPENVWLPNLKYAHFNSFILEDENSIQRFLNGCPILETFKLVIRVTDDDEIQTKTLWISSISLKFLKMKWDKTDDGSEMNVAVKSENLQSLKLDLKGGHKVYIDAPDLKYLLIRGQVFELNLLQCLDSIEEAVLSVKYLHLFEDLVDLYSRSQIAFKFFCGLQNLRLLSLSEDILKVLCVPLRLMPTFPNLCKIKVFADDGDKSPSSLIEQVLFNMFGSCPNLLQVIVELP